MKKSLLIITLFLSLLGCCKSQDYIAFVKPAIEPIKYGALYNWYAATDSRNICSSGFHVPTKTDFQTLETYLGGSTVAGGKLKKTGTDYWSAPNTGATNEVGFNARPAGQRTNTGSFQSIGGNMFIHSSTQYNASLSWVRVIFSVSTNFNEILAQKQYGNSLRAMRVATTPELSLPDGLISATYTGNDGKIYRCCKVGTQVYTADNLAETKFANGDWIHGYDGGTYTPISNASWAALTTDGMCFYNDDPLAYK